MTKQKVSVTLSPERVARAREVTGRDNMSALLDDALEALVERELERRWLAGQIAAQPQSDLPDDLPVDLSEVPWDDR